MQVFLSNHPALANWGSTTHNSVRRPSHWVARTRTLESQCCISNLGGSDVTPLPIFPAAVLRYVGSAFAAVNRRVSEKFALVPGSSEPSLDMTFIDHLSRYVGPRIVAPGLVVRIDVHFLGGLRHFYGWEIADIGVMVLARQHGKTVAKKVALLQSKRLYPSNSAPVHEETPEEFKIGFGGLLPGSHTLPSLALSHSYTFTDQSKYQALRAKDDQYLAIKDYEKTHELPVYYLLYNPWKVPSHYTFPHVGPLKLGARANGGCRIVPAAAIRGKLDGKSKG